MRAFVMFGILLTSQSALATDVKLEVYNGSAVNASECRVYGKSTTSNRSALLLTQPTTGSNHTAYYTIDVPTEWDLVAVSCRATSGSKGPVSQAYGKATQNLNAQPPSQQGLKGNCGSAAPDAKCVVSVVGI